MAFLDWVMQCFLAVLSVIHAELTATLERLMEECGLFAALYFASPVTTYSFNEPVSLVTSCLIPYHQLSFRFSVVTIPDTVLPAMSEGQQLAY